MVASHRFLAPRTSNHSGHPLTEIIKLKKIIIIYSISRYVSLYFTNCWMQKINFLPCKLYAFAAPWTLLPGVVAPLDHNSDAYITHYFHNCNIRCTRILTCCHLLKDTYFTYKLNNSRNTPISFTHRRIYSILNDTKWTCGTAMIFNQSSINGQNKEKVINYKSNRVTGTKITL